MSQKPDWLEPHGTPWRRGEARVVYENPWIALTEHAAVAPTGAPATYGLVGFKNLALAVLPIHEDGGVVLVGQHRFPFGDYSWEIPEGGGPMGEDPLDGAKRELAEEAGLAASEWREIMRIQLSNSVTDELAIGYLATGLAPAPGVPMKVTGVAASTAIWRVWSSTRSRPCPVNRHTMRPSSFVNKNTTCDNKRQAYPENPGKVTATSCIPVLVCYNSPPWPGSSVGRAED